MRIGLVLAADPHQGVAALVRQAQAAEAAGLDLGWLEEGAHAAPPTIAAASLAPRTSTLRIVASLAVGPHPLSIAEAAVVADNCTQGRLGLVVSSDDADLLEETLAVLTPALTTRPFRHRGARWQIPANLPENDGAEHAIVVTPGPAQLELPLWLAGAAAPAVARRHGRSHVATASEGDPEREWADTEHALGAAAERLARPAVWDVGADARGQLDADGLVARILEERAAWGLDAIVLRPPAGLALDARERLAAQLGSHVRPRIVQHELPPGLERHWREELADQLAAIRPGD